MARYLGIQYDAPKLNLVWQQSAAKKAIAKKLDGSYLLKTGRQDLSADGIWRTYLLLTRVERAFRDMKSPLMERPIFHHLEHLIQTHLFLCLLAYHLLVSSEEYFLGNGIHTSWWTIHQRLSTHQVVTVVLARSTSQPTEKKLCEWS